MDSLMQEARIYAVLSKSSADSAEYPFAYYANAQTLDITPTLKRNADAYITGKTETRFAPDDALTRAEAAALFSRLMTDTRPAQDQQTFLDVLPQDWFYPAVNSMSEKGILSGYGDGSFHAEAAITRAEFATLAAKFLYDGTAGDEPVFSDCSASHWAYPSVAKMAASGFLNGYADGTFLPEQPITRAEAVAILNKLLGKTAPPETNTSRFDDLTPSHWAYREIMTALGA